MQFVAFGRPSYLYEITCSCGKGVYLKYNEDAGKFLPDPPGLWKQYKERWYCGKEGHFEVSARVVHTCLSWFAEKLAYRMSLGDAPKPES